MKGIRNNRPSLPRYTSTWNTEVVVSFLKEFDHGTLKTLTLKLVMLLALVTAQRAQTLSKLKLGDMVDRGNSIEFRISSALKNKAPGVAQIHLKEFAEDRRICVVTILKLYLSQTKNLRKGGDENVLVSWIKPYNPVHVDTIRRWILIVMGLSGIDTATYKPHSTRAASSSKAKQSMVPIDGILAAGMWSKESTFAKYYNKDIHEPNEDNIARFQKAVLGGK